MISITNELAVKILYALRFHPGECNGEFGHCEGCDLKKNYFYPVIEELEKRLITEPFVCCPMGSESNPCNLSYGHRGKHMFICG